MNIVDVLLMPIVKPVILRGGPYGLNGEWITDVEFTDARGARVVATLTRQELAQWRKSSCR